MANSGQCLRNINLPILSDHLLYTTVASVVYSCMSYVGICNNARSVYLVLADGYHHCCPLRQITYLGSNLYSPLFSYNGLRNRASNRPRHPPAGKRATTLAVLCSVSPRNSSNDLPPILWPENYPPHREHS